MAEARIESDLIVALRSGGDALDHSERGPKRELALLRDAGLLIAPMPTADGGRGWGTSAAGADSICDVLMALGGASLPVARLYEGHVNAVALIVRHGTADQRKRLADAIGGGAMLGVWGADSERPVTMVGGATSQRLCGSKAFASGLGDLALAIVTARTEHGLQMVLVDASDPARADHSTWDVDGMVGSRSGRFDCEGLTADPGNCIGATNALFLEPDFHGGVWRLAACYAGAMVRLAELSEEWLEQRGQSANPQMTARLGSTVIEAETAVLWSRHAAETVEGIGVDSDEAVRSALFAREAIEQAATRLLIIIERVNGTAMHRRGSETGRIARDLRFYLRQADLDGKMALATGHWRNRHRF